MDSDSSINLRVLEETLVLLTVKSNILFHVSYDCVPAAKQPFGSDEVDSIAFEVEQLAPLIKLTCDIVSFVKSKEIKLKYTNNAYKYHTYNMISLSLKNIQIDINFWWLNFYNNYSHRKLSKQQVDLKYNL